MARDRENYCYLLGLNPLREDKYSRDDVNERIQKREEEWRKKSQDPQTSAKLRFQASRNLSMVPDMKSTMGSPVLREAEFKSGRERLAAKASNLRRTSITLHDGTIYIPPGEADNLAARIKWKDVRGDDLLKAFGDSVSKAPQPAEQDVLVAYKNITDVGETSPTTLLNTLIETPGLEININRLDERSSNDDLRIAFGVVNQRLNAVKAGKIANQDAYIQAMRSLKMVLTPDEKLRTLNNYCACMDAMEPAMDALDEGAGTTFTAEYLDGLLSVYGKGVPDAGMCRDILESYCCKKKYFANFSGKDSSLTLCPTCKGIVYDSPDISFCPVCGSSVRLVCPHCGKSQTVTNDRCVNCGRQLEKEISSAKRTADDVRKMAAAGNPVGAAKKLQTLVEGFPSYPENAELEELVRKSERNLGDIVRRVSDDYSIRHYYDLKTTVENGLRRFPSLLEDKQVSTMYREACDKAGEADRLCMEASAMTSDQALDVYIRAADRCPDHPQAVERLKDYPPEGPADATAEARDDTVLVKFAVPEERRGTTFCVYRGKGGLPLVDASTVPVAEVGGSVFLDKTVDPGADYFYKIYSKRWGILSRDFAQCGPVMVLREVTKVDLVPIEDGLRITYEPPKGCSRVRIWRKEGVTAAGSSAEIEVRHDGSVFNDRGLKGGATYSYLFVAEYDVGGRTERSLGTIFTGKTVRYPTPVNDMEISWNRSDGTYTARWGSKEKVSLYATPKKAKIFGTTVPMDDLQRWMTRIEPIETYENGCRFEIDDGAVVYVYPMIPIGSTAIRGREVMIANLRPFRDVERRMSGTDCDLSMTWPDGAEAAVAVVSDSADKVDDPTSEKLTVSREGYEADRKIRIHMGSSPRKTVTLYAVYEIDGAKLRSRGITLEVFSGSVNKVRYTVSVQPVKGQRGSSEVVVDLECPDAAEVPRVVMVRTAEGIPLKARDGQTVWDSEGPVAMEGGKARRSFVVPKDEAAIERMRLFFADVDEYNLFKLVHPLYRRDRNGFHV